MFGRRGTPPDWSQREPGGRCRFGGLVVALLVQDQERATAVPLLREDPGAGLMASVPSGLGVVGNSGVARENWSVFSGAVIGRDAELDFVQAFLDEVGGGPAGLVLSGEAGIGKTILWQAGVEHARGRFAHVLTCRGTEAEAALSFAGLSELLGEVLGDALDSLLPPRRRALEVALLLVGAGTGTAGSAGDWAGRTRRAARRWRSTAPCLSRSTTCSGSTPRRRARSRSRSGVCARTGLVCSSLRDRTAGATIPLGLERSLPSSGSRFCRSGR